VVAHFQQGERQGTDGRNGVLGFNATGFTGRRPTKLLGITGKTKGSSELIPKGSRKTYRTQGASRRRRSGERQQRPTGGAALTAKAAKSKRITLAMERKTRSRRIAAEAREGKLYTGEAQMKKGRQ